MKPLFDFHVHSEISPDSEETMLNQAAAAVQAGVRALAFTDHYDEDYPYDGGFGAPDLIRYFRNLEEVRGRFPTLRIASGIELGMMSGSIAKIRKTLEPWEFDFILFSKHVVEGRDPWFADFFADWTLREGERQYLEQMIDDIIAYDDFDVVGHIGYVDKYLQQYAKPVEGRPFTWSDFPDVLDTLLRTLVERGKGIEVNTSSLEALGGPMPNPSILRRYRELGGEIVTTGSDAHRADRVGYGIGSALDLLAECGFKWVCTFRERRPQFCRLGGGT